jgi:hypothetical protein
MIALLSVGSPLPAREPPVEIRHYEVEIIIFTRNWEGAGSTEYWPPLTEPPDWSQAVALNNSDTPHREILKLPATGHRLGKEYRKLKATRGRLQPMLHLAWRQPVLSREESIPVYVRSREVRGQTAPLAEETFPELEGTIRVSGKRYLHVHLDLLLRRLTPPDLTSDEATELADPTIFAPQYQAYRMLDHRRMRSNRLHYVDHPLFGVLVLATPYESPEPEQPEAPSPEAPSPQEQTPQSESQSGEESASQQSPKKPQAQPREP